MKQFKYNYNNQSGMYRHKITLQERSVTQDEYFQEIETLVDWGSYFSMVKTLKGDEIVSAAQEKQKLVKRFVIKYTKRLQEFIDREGTGFTLVQNGVEYEVTSALDDDDLHETITIIAETNVIKGGVVNG